MSDRPDTLGARIRAARLRRQFTLAELGRKIGLSTDRLSALETRGGNPRMATLQKLARVLHISLDDLVGPAEELPWVPLPQRLGNHDTPAPPTRMHRIWLPLTQVLPCPKCGETMTVGPERWTRCPRTGCDAEIVLTVQGWWREPMPDTGWTTTPPGTQGP
jgi:transcriptional regulator with XRE-family HTH domain